MNTMINNVVLVGRLTRDPDLRYTQSGAAVATFNLAVNRNFTNQNGDREADFINCVIWRKAAETLANYAHKGSLIGITGRIQTRSYDNQQGQKVYVTEVVCDNFQLLEPKSMNEQRQNYSGNSAGGYNNSGMQQTQSSNPSFGGQSSPQNEMPNFDRNADPFADGSPIDISDDDLPF